SSATSATTTFAPAACSRRTVASPSPPVPPTTIAELPWICIALPSLAIIALRLREYYSQVYRQDRRRGGNWSELMPEAVIVSALRTPIGTAVKGTLRETTAFDLAHHVVEATTKQLETDAPVDDLILGEGRYGGGVIARHAAITAGLTGVPGLAHNRHCAAGMAAVQTAAAGIRAGMDRLVVAGGGDAGSPGPRARCRAGPDD